MCKIDCVNCKYYDSDASGNIDWCNLNHEETGICGNCERDFEDLDEATEIYNDKSEECDKWFSIHLKQSEEIANLKKQLAEKVKEIEELKLDYDCSVACADENIENLEIEIYDLKQEKTNFAIEQLEKVKDSLRCNTYTIDNSKFDYTRTMILWTDLNEYIDNQIKKLKENK